MKRIEKLGKLLADAGRFEVTYKLVEAVNRSTPSVYIYNFRCRYRILSRDPSDLSILKDAQFSLLALPDSIAASVWQGNGLVGLAVEKNLAVQRLAAAMERATKHPRWPLIDGWITCHDLTPAEIRRRNPNERYVARAHGDARQDALQTLWYLQKQHPPVTVLTNPDETENT